MTTKELLKRALDIKLAVRVRDSGQICMPWDCDVVKNEVYYPQLFLAKPCSITRSLASFWNGYDVCKGVGPIPLKQIGRILTYHPQNFTDDSFSIAGALRQIPTEIDGQKVVAFEFIDAIQGKYINPQNLQREKVLKTVLYALSDGKGWSNPEIIKQPVIYKGKKITRKNFDEMIEKLGEND